MRALALFLVALSSCSLAVDTSELSGGARPDTGTSITPDSATDTGTCDPEQCVDDPVVVNLADIAPCAAETTDKAGCRAKVAAACKAKNPCCYKGGYGPVEFPNAAEATILCFYQDAYQAPLTEVLGAASGCTSSALASRACDNAVHVSAKKRGNGSGVLQTVAGDKANIVGLDSDSAEEKTDVAWSDLTALDSGCTMANAEKQACTTAVQRYCTTGEFDGYLGGIGPLTWTASTVTVVCLF